MWQSRTPQNRSRARGLLGEGGELKAILEWGHERGGGADRMNKTEGMRDRKGGREKGREGGREREEGRETGEGEESGPFTHFEW